MSDQRNMPDEQLAGSFQPSAGQAANNGVAPNHADPEDLVLYAMQFLNREQAASTASHLAACAGCREELARVQGDLATYAFATELESPPAAARQRLLAQVAREKKIVPIIQQAEPAPQAQPTLHALPALPALTPFGRSGSILNPIEEEEKPRRSAGLAVFGGIGWAIAAGLAFFAFTLHRDSASLRGALASRAGELQRLNADAATSHQLLDALTDPKAIRVELTTKPEPKVEAIGGVTYNPEKGTLVFLASDLNPLQPLKTYELWVIPADGSAAIPAGTFRPDDQGNASVIVPDLPRGVAAKAFGVTIEPDGGSQSPTLPLILSGS